MPHSERPGAGLYLDLAAGSTVIRAMIRAVIRERESSGRATLSGRAWPTHPAPPGTTCRLTRSVTGPPLAGGGVAAGPWVSHAQVTIRNNSVPYRDLMQVMPRSGTIHILPS